MAPCLNRIVYANVTGAQATLSTECAVIIFRTKLLYQSSGLLEGRQSAEPSPQLLALSAQTAVVGINFGVAKVLRFEVGARREMIH